MQVPVQNPQHQNQPMASQPMAQPVPMQETAAYAPRPRSSRAPWIVLAVVVVLALAALAFVFRGSFGPKTDSGLSGYQAVFLTNGQVYFGKMGRGSSDYVTMTDIYYLQENGQQQGSSTAQQAAAAANPQLSLVKLGNELHGPQDLMFINRSQILFYENMESSGKVAQAIAAYKASNAAAASGAGANGAGAAAAPATAGGSAAQMQNPATTSQGAGPSAPVAPVTK